MAFALAYININVIRHACFYQIVMFPVASRIIIFFPMDQAIITGISIKDFECDKIPWDVIGRFIAYNITH